MNEIYFFMSGMLSVGYNHRKRVLEYEIDDADFPISPDDGNFQKIKMEVSSDLINNVKASPEQKSRFPLKFK